MDLLENTHVGKKLWGLVFYGVKSKLLAYYILGSKDPTSDLTLEALGNFIVEHGIPRMIIKDSDGVLGAGGKWRHFLGQMFTLLRLSKTDKHNHNPVKHVIKKLMSGLSKLKNACGTWVLAYHCEAMEYLCIINNYIYRANLGNQLPFEAL